MYGLIWKSAYDDTDGYYVEIISAPHNIVECSVWRDTISECIQWLKTNNVSNIRYN